MIKNARHMWTKNEVKKVQSMWNTSTKEEICEELNLESHQIMYIVNAMRKAGFDLPKKHKKGQLQNLLREILAEQK
jgi:hypothetical protein